MATPRKTEISFPEVSAPWTLRSAGGTRPTVIVWGTPAPAESVLDRLARAGLAVLTPSEHATPVELQSALASLPAPIRVVLVEASNPDVTKTLDANKVPWRHVTSEWDDLPGWFAGPVT